MLLTTIKSRLITLLYVISQWPKLRHIVLGKMVEGNHLEAYAF